MLFTRAVFTLIVLLPAALDAQIVIFRNPFQEAAGVHLEGWLVTVNHYRPFLASRRWIQTDVAARPSAIATYFKTSRADPAFFIDRRGHEVSLKLIQRQALELIVDVEFFSGESGLPVFDRHQRVVGIVTGNVHRNSVLGRVALLPELFLRPVQSPTASGYLPHETPKHHPPLGRVDAVPRSRVQFLPAPTSTSPDGKEPQERPRTLSGQFSDE